MSAVDDLILEPYWKALDDAYAELGRQAAKEFLAELKATTAQQVLEKPEPKKQLSTDYFWE